jgi:hypothetical protein
LSFGSKMVVEQRLRWPLQGKELHTRSIASPDVLRY